MAEQKAFAALADFVRQSGPIIIILVGPNGAGKSTFYGRYLKPINLPFINADVLAKTLIDSGAPAGEETERLAADLAEKKRQGMIANGESFITETVFSDPVQAKVKALREAQNAGYTVILIFLCVDSAELTALRVETRVAAGGHNVPRERIAARYERMRVNVKAAIPFVDLGILVDNSSLETPLRPVAVTQRGMVVDRFPPLPWWAEDVLPSE